MKKLVLFMIIALTTSIVSAQNPKVVSAYNYLKYGQVEKAKEAIDKAIVHPKTINKAKTWWYCGNVYQAISDSCMYKKNEKFCSLSENPLDFAFDSYIKAMVLNFKDPKWHTLDIVNNETDMKAFGMLLNNRKTKYDNPQIFADIFMNRFPNLANSYVNKGVAEFQSADPKENDKAVKSFETSLFLSSATGKMDTTIFYYTALAAQKVKDYETSNEYFAQSIKLEYGKADFDKANIYKSYANNYKNLGDTAKYLEYLNKGIETYPDASEHLVVELINYFIDAKKTDDALNYLKIAIARTPNNSSYLYSLGATYEKKGYVDSAIMSYSNAIEINPNDLSSHYNLGAIYYNDAVNLFNTLNDIPPDQQKKYDKAKADAKAFFAKSQPYFEKAHEIDSEDYNTIVSLVEVYARLSMYEKSKEMKAKLEALK
ncbi:MAG: tetratricopeptide repeat protein [Bacteroidetes bacterium]|nr:tetratricopeptide repeat protein [Bacteroidota bacterium]MBT6685063.1 tetratricopeptide repeat protein [Bacteroidota bacterium]MBT7144552.1 tetratricopeptide repeat protein [Bacteroidota bacterium]MBT7491783.1 tetratricopeptide repeat protein [Bacteroidota bacterium]